MSDTSQVSSASFLNSFHSPLIPVPVFWVNLNLLLPAMQPQASTASGIEDNFGLEEPELKLSVKKPRKDAEIVTVTTSTWGNEGLPGFSSDDEDVNGSKGKRGKTRQSKEEGNARKSNSRVTDDSRRESLKEDHQRNRGGWRRRYAPSSSGSEEEVKTVIDNQQLWEQQERNCNELRQKRSEKKDSRVDSQRDSDEDRDFYRDGRKKETRRNNNYDKLTPEERAETERERDI
jgi:hypothetical protein